MIDDWSFSVLHIDDTADLAVDSVMVVQTFYRLKMTDMLSNILPSPCLGKLLGEESVVK